jgi:Tol biopolymer transport system component
MTFPRKASVRWLALLTFTTLAALPLSHASAQQAAPAKASSTNGRIIFHSTQGGDGFTCDIYLMDADGKHQTRLTDNTASDDVLPVWSPAGGQIAFQSNRNGNGYEIYLMNADGSNQRPLRSAANGGPVFGQSIEWSPDGTRLAYSDGDNVYVTQAVAPGGGDSVVAPMNVSGGKALGSSDVEVSWAPQVAGDRLVVRNAQSCGGCSDLYTVNADGTGRAQLTNGVGFDIHARWSPDGTLIAYEADRGGRGIYVVGAGGGAETKVSGAVGSFGVVEWSPVGSRLAFKSSLSNVYAVNPDGSGLTLLTDVPADGGTALFWSPDGTKVGFHNFNGTAVDIYVVNADGSRKATNYTKSRRDDEFSSSWQKLPTQ